MDGVHTVTKGAGYFLSFFLFFGSVCWPCVRTIEKPVGARIKTEGFLHFSFSYFEFENENEKERGKKGANF